MVIRPNRRSQPLRRVLKWYTRTSLGIPSIGNRPSPVGRVPSPQSDFTLYPDAWNVQAARSRHFRPGGGPVIEGKHPKNTSSEDSLVPKPLVKARSGILAPPTGRVASYAPGSGVVVVSLSVGSGSG